MTEPEIITVAITNKCECDEDQDHFVLEKHPDKKRVVLCYECDKEVGDWCWEEFRD